MLKSISSPCPSTLHPLLQLCHHLSVSPLKDRLKLSSLLLDRLKLGRIRIKCPRLYLLQELPVLPNALSNVCDQPAGCGSAVHIEKDKQVNAVLETVNEYI